MKRREFLGLAGGAMAWPTATLAQQPLPVLGFLSARSPQESAGLLAAFRRGLTESGIVENQNVAIEYRWALGDYDRLPVMAADLVGRPVTVLVSVGGEASVRAAMAATKSIPVVGIFADDPVASGLTASVNRPGGNTTGVFNFNPALEPKRLGLLHELVPQATTVGVLVNPNYPPAASQLKGAEEAARSMDIQIFAMRAGKDAEIEAAFEAAHRQGVRAVAVTSDPYFNTRSEKLVGLAARHALPTIYPFREHATAGGLMSYGVNIGEMYRQVGVYAGRILKGAQPSDLPIVQPIKFDFVINLKTAGTLGVKFPDKLISLADEVIE